MKKHDTLDIYDRLEKNGFDAEQARVITKVFQETSNMLEDNMFEKLEAGFEKVHNDIKAMDSKFETKFESISKDITNLKGNISNNRWTTILSTFAIVASIVFAVVHLG